MLLAAGIIRAQEYSFRSFGTAEGLNNLAVRQVYQDRVGFIWVSTENGIYRYDGDRFEAFGPAQGIPITSGAALGDAPNGTLLVGATVGLYHLRGNRFEKLGYSRVQTLVGLKGTTLQVTAISESVPSEDQIRECDL
jgi:hypothetical protein